MSVYTRPARNNAQRETLEFSSLVPRVIAANRDLIKGKVAAVAWLLNVNTYTCVLQVAQDLLPTIEVKAPGGHEKRSTTGFSPIRITPHFVEPLSSTFRTQLTSQNGVLMKVLSLLSNTLQVRPIPGSFTIPPTCDEYTYGKNVGKCRNMRTTQCGSYTVPSQFVGKRELCTSPSGSCYEAGPDGAGVANTDFLLFVRTQSKFTKWHIKLLVPNKTLHTGTVIKHFCYAISNI